MATTTVVKKKPNWFLAFLASSIGRKILMGLTGLFLILFITIHLVGNLQLLIPILFGEQEAGKAFNQYAHFMGHNEIIQIISIGNFTFILLHIFVSIWLTRSNMVARPVGYAYNGGNRSSVQSRNMMILGTIVLIFLIVHIPHFWAKSKFGGLEPITYNGIEMHNLYKATVEAFKQEMFVIIYVLGMIGLAFHLSHGFQSAFQTLGLNHKKYTPFIKTLGFIYSIIVPLGFALIPILMYFY